MLYTIISLWPLDLIETRPRLSLTKVFQIPAAPIGGFSRLEVTDSEERDYQGGDQYFNRLVSADELAKDLVGEYRRFTCGQDGRVGVFLMEGRPTDAQVINSREFAEAHEQQDRLCRNLIIEARLLQSKGLSNTICDRHFKAATYANLEGEDWQGHDLTRSARKQCPFCAKYVTSIAIKCPECREVIDPIRYAEQVAASKAIIDAHVQQATMLDNSGSAIRPSSTALKAAPAKPKEEAVKA